MSDVIGEITNSAIPHRKLKTSSNTSSSKQLLANNTTPSHDTENRENIGSGRSKPFNQSASIQVKSRSVEHRSIPASTADKKESAKEFDARIFSKEHFLKQLLGESVETQPRSPDTQQVVFEQSRFTNVPVPLSFGSSSSSTASEELSVAVETDLRIPLLQPSPWRESTMIVGGQGRVTFVDESFDSQTLVNLPLRGLESALKPPRRSMSSLPPGLGSASKPSMSATKKQDEIEQLKDVLLSQLAWTRVRDSLLRLDEMLRQDDVDGEGLIRLAIPLGMHLNNGRSQIALAACACVEAVCQYSSMSSKVSKQELRNFSREMIGPLSKLASSLSTGCKTAQEAGVRCLFNLFLACPELNLSYLMGYDMGASKNVSARRVAANLIFNLIHASETVIPDRDEALAEAVVRFFVDQDPETRQIARTSLKDFALLRPASWIEDRIVSKLKEICTEEQVSYLRQFSNEYPETSRALGLEPAPRPPISAPPSSRLVPFTANTSRRMSQDMQSLVDAQTPLRTPASIRSLPYSPSYQQHLSPDGHVVSASDAYIKVQDDVDSSPVGGILLARKLNRRFEMADNSPRVNATRDGLFTEQFVGGLIELPPLQEVPASSAFDVVSETRSSQISSKSGNKLMENAPNKGRSWGALLLPLALIPFLVFLSISLWSSTFSAPNVDQETIIQVPDHQSHPDLFKSRFDVDSDHSKEDEVVLEDRITEADISQEAEERIDEDSDLVPEEENGSGEVSVIMNDEMPTNSEPIESDLESEVEDAGKIVNEDVEGNIDDETRVAVEDRLTSSTDVEDEKHLEDSLLDAMEDPSSEEMENLHHVPPELYENAGLDSGKIEEVVDEIIADSIETVPKSAVEPLDKVEPSSDIGSSTSMTTLVVVLGGLVFYVFGTSASQSEAQGEDFAEEEQQIDDEPVLRRSTRRPSPPKGRFTAVEVADSGMHPVVRSRRVQDPDEVSVQEVEGRGGITVITPRKTRSRRSSSKGH